MKCSRCNRGYYKTRSKQLLCIVHYRIGQMRDTARARGKQVPDWNDLDRMACDLELCGMVCHACGTTMTWTGIRDNSRNVVSLQHDRNGAIRLLCMKCNLKHASFPGDEFYNHTTGESAFCTRCDQILPMSSFYKGKAGACCKECRKTLNQSMWKKYGRMWYANSKAKKHASI